MELSLYNRYLRVFSNRSFLFVWLAEVFSQLAANMSMFVLLLLAFSLTKTNLAVGAIIITFAIPAIFFGAFAGAYVDKKNKKHVLIITNVLRAFLLFLLIFLHKNLIAIYTFTFLISLVTQFFIPAEAPMIPLLVEKEDLLPANALFSVAYYGSVFLAFALSGPVILLFGIGNAFFLLAISFTLAGVFASLVKPLESANKDTQNAKIPVSIFLEIKETIKVLVKLNHAIQALLLLILSQTIILTIAALGPGYAQSVLHIAIEQFPLLFVAPAAVGLGIGGLFFLHYADRLSKRNIISLGIFLSACVLCIFPYVTVIPHILIIRGINHILPAFLRITTIHVLVVGAFSLGLANSFIFVPANTILQNKTSKEIHGKIYGILNSLIGIVSLLPLFATSAIADVFGVGIVFILLSIVLFLIGIIQRFM